MAEKKKVVRDENGRFIKGSGTPPRSNTKFHGQGLIKKESKEHVYKCARDITVRPWKEVESEYKKPEATALELLVAQSVSRRDKKFISWVIEMVIGRAPQGQLDEPSGAANIVFPVTKEKQEELIEMTLQAREKKLIEENGGKTSKSAKK